MKIILKAIGNDGEFTKEIDTKKLLNDAVEEMLCKVDDNAEAPDSETSSTEDKDTITIRFSGNNKDDSCECHEDYSTSCCDEECCCEDREVECCNLSTIFDNCDFGVHNYDMLQQLIVSGATFTNCSFMLFGECEAESEMEIEKD